MNFIKDFILSRLVSFSRFCSASILHFSPLSRIFILRARYRATYPYKRQFPCPLRQFWNSRTVKRLHLDSQVYQDLLER